MAVTEESRYEVHKYFEEAMGRERATTLMELLPPVGWGDVATKQDVLLVKQDVLLVKQDLLLVKEDIGRLREWASETFATKSDWHEVHVELHKVVVEVHKVHNSVLRELRIWATTLFMAMIALMGVAAGLG